MVKILFMPPEERQQCVCGEGQETADTYKACQPFLPLSRLFCSAVLRLQNVLTEPLKKQTRFWGGYPNVNHSTSITQQY